MLSRSDERLLQGLRQRRTREREGLFLAEGIRVVEELLASGIDLHLAAVSPTVEDTGRGRALLQRLEARCPVHRIGPGELARLADTDTPQGVIVAARTPVVALDDVALRERDTVLVLDAVQDPGNFGTLVRSADAFGVRALIALTGTVDPWNAKAVRAAAGSSFRVAIVQAPVEALRVWAEANRVAIVVAAGDGESVERYVRPARVALVVGNEGAGVGAAVRAVATGTLAVPAPGAAESLNVAAAAAILLYLLTRAERE